MNPPLAPQFPSDDPRISRLLQSHSVLNYPLGTNFLSTECQSWEVHLKLGGVNGRIGSLGQLGTRLVPGHVSHWPALSSLGKVFIEVEAISFPPMTQFQIPILQRYQCDSSHPQGLGEWVTGPSVYKEDTDSCQHSQFEACLLSWWKYLWFFNI